MKSQLARYDAREPGCGVLRDYVVLLVIVSTFVLEIIVLFGFCSLQP